jgi:hypothetical protein
MGATGGKKPQRSIPTSLIERIDSRMHDCCLPLAEPVLIKPLPPFFLCSPRRFVRGAGEASQCHRVSVHARDICTGRITRKVDAESRFRLLLFLVLSFIKEYLGASVSADTDKLKSTIDSQAKLIEEKEREIQALKKQLEALSVSS